MSRSIHISAAHFRTRRQIVYSESTQRSHRYIQLLRDWFLSSTYTTFARLVLIIHLFAMTKGACVVVSHHEKSPSSTLTREVPTFVTTRAAQKCRDHHEQ